MLFVCHFFCKSMSAGIKSRALPPSSLILCLLPSPPCVALPAHWHAAISSLLTAGGVHFALTKSLGGMHAAPVTAAALLDG